MTVIDRTTASSHGHDVVVETRHYPADQPDPYLVEVSLSYAGGRRHVDNWFRTREAALSCHGALVAHLIVPGIEP